MILTFLRVLEIRGTALRVVLPALVLTFPSLTGNFCFMFTSAAYAWSFFLAAVLTSSLTITKDPRSPNGSIVLTFPPSW